MDASIRSARRPVWIALSELFLDNEFGADEQALVAETLAASPYSLEELDSILWKEVSPVLCTNTVSVAGEWAGFDPGWLEEQITARLRRPVRWPWWLLPRYVAREAWKDVRPRVEALRSAGESG